MSDDMFRIQYEKLLIILRTLQNINFIYNINLDAIIKRVIRENLLIIVRQENIIFRHAIIFGVTFKELDLKVF